MAKKGKLYTANKWNQPLFMPKEENLFWPGGNIEQKAYADYQANPWNYTQDYQYGNGPSITEQYKAQNTKGINWGSFGQGAAGIASMIPENEMQIGDKTFKRGLWDALDPTYYAAKGRKSGAGDTLSDVGVTLTKTGAASGNGWLALAGAAAKIIGSGVNAMWGTKTDQDTLDSLAASTQQKQAVGNALGQASTNEDLINLSGYMTGGVDDVDVNDIYDFGKWVSRKKRNKMRNEGRQIINAEKGALAYQNHALGTSADRIDKQMDNAIMQNFAAYGGPIYQMGIMGNNNNMGAAIDYGFMSDYLASKNKQAEVKDTSISSNMFAGVSPSIFAKGGGIHINPKNKGKFNATKKRTGKTTEELTHSKNPLTRKRAIFAQNARKWKHDLGGPLYIGSLVQPASFGEGGLMEDDTLFALGGDMQMNGGDFTSGLTRIDAGKSHEENPNDGVQMGLDPQGAPNLVEENETVYDDYVFSQRIACDDSTKEKFHINKKKDITYAELSKLLEQKMEVKEKVNDSIAQAGFKAAMQTLAGEQERQKAEMEAQRAQEAFDALSDEEKAAVMQQAAEQANAATMMQQSETTPEEAEIQSQAMKEENDGQAALVMQQTEPMACGGKMYAGGGSTINPYTYSTDWAGFDYYDPATGTYDQGYLDFIKAINQDWVNRILAGQYGSMDRYLARNAGKNLTPEQVAALASDKKYSDMHKAAAAAYKEYLEGVDPVTGEKKVVAVATPDNGDAEPEVFVPRNVVVNGSQYDSLDGLTPEELAAGYILEQSLPAEYGGVNVYRKKTSPDGGGTADGEDGEEPRHRAEWPRYAGLAGPLVGLGMMQAGIGRPDYRELDAAVATAQAAPSLAGYKTIGDYLTYRPMDIWAEQNRLDANTRAADRAIMSGNNPARYAALLANNYNAQLASGDLYRKALEYNDAKRAQVAEFNRGTNQYNADAYTRNSQFNADAINRANQYKAGLAAQIASQKLGYDNDWYGSMYANMGNLFQGLSDLGRENALWNMVSKTAADTTNLGDSYTGDIYLKKGKKRSKGGKLNKNDLKL